MHYQRLLAHSIKLLSVYYIMAPIFILAEQKTIQFIMVKTANEKREMFPINQAFLEEIQRLFGTTIFVETGTYLGDSCAIAATIFKHVYTIELGNTLFVNACQRFAQTPNVSLYQGDSGIVLNQLLPTINTDHRILFWLDSHWSGGITARGEDVPILRELDAIKKSGIKNSIILIDDIRVFQNQPTENSYNSDAATQYPEPSLIMEHIREINTDYICWTYGDVLLAYTDHDIIVPSLIQAMTISRLNCANDEILAQAESVIAAVTDEDYHHLHRLVIDLETSTADWNIHYYDFWFALALHHRGNMAEARKHMVKAAQLGGFHRAHHYLALWH